MSVASDPSSSGFLALLLEKGPPAASDIANSLLGLKDCLVKIVPSYEELLAALFELHPQLVLLSDAFIQSADFGALAEIRRADESAYLIALLPPQPDADLVSLCMEAGVNQC